MSWNINEVRNRIKSLVALKYKPAYDLILESYNKFGDGGTKPVVLKGLDFADAVLRDERMKRAAALLYLDINHKFGLYKDNPKYKDQFDEFVLVMRPIFKEALIRNGYPLTNLDNLVRQAGFESRYGLDPRGDKGFNFAGIKWNKNSSSYDHSKHTDGEDYIDFDNLYDFANYHVLAVNNKWDGLNANNTVDFVERLHPNNGGLGSYSGNVDGYRSNLTHMKSLDKYLEKANVEYPINPTYKPYAERLISPAGILLSLGAIRSNGGNLFLTGGSEGIFGTFNPILKLRDRLYEANSPSDYSIGRHIEDTLHPENRVILSDPVAEAMWANYMNLENYYTKDSKLNISSLPVTGMLLKAQYSPTIGTPKYKNVYEVNPELLNTENAYYHPVNDDVLYDLVTKNAADNSITKNSLHNNSLGTYGVSLGEDENGKYISYYDDWDINPFSDNSYSKKDDESNLMKAGRAVLGGFDDISVVGKPFSVYGRRYYTDDDIERIRRLKSRALGGNLFTDGGYKEPKHWNALQSVPHHVVADPNWNNNIETFVPNNVKRIWPNITDEELSKGYYKNNPYPGENTILYNPNDKTVDANTIALDGLHFMHDNPTYEDFYSDLVTSMRRDPELVFTSLMDQTGDDALSRNITTKFIKGESLTSEDKEYLQPAIDGYLRRQFAPDYMRGVRGGYDTAYKGDKSILDKTEAIRDLMESFILPEVTVTASNLKALGGNLFAKGGEEDSELEYVDPNAVNITNPQTLTFNDEGAPMWLGEDNVWRTIPNGGIYLELPEVTVTAQGDEVVPAHLYNQYKDWQANTQRINMGDYNAHNPIDRALRQFNPEGGTTGRDFLNYLEKSGLSALSTINMGRAGAGIPSVGFLATEAVPTAYAALQTAGNWLAPKIFTESGALTEGAGKFMLSIPGMEAGREVGEMVYPHMSLYGNTWNEDWEKYTGLPEWTGDFSNPFMLAGADPIMGVKNIINAEKLGYNLGKQRFFSLWERLRKNRNSNTQGPSGIIEGLPILLDEPVPIEPVSTESIWPFEVVDLSREQIGSNIENLPMDHEVFDIDPIMWLDGFEHYGHRYLSGTIETPLNVLYDLNGNIVSEVRVPSSRGYFDYPPMYTHNVDPDISLYDSEGRLVKFRHDIRKGYEAPSIQIPENPNTKIYGYEHGWSRSTIYDNPLSFRLESMPYVYDSEGNLKSTRKDFILNPEDTYYDALGNKMEFVEREEPTKRGFTYVDNGFPLLQPKYRDVPYSPEEASLLDWFDKLDEDIDITSTSFFEDDAKEANRSLLELIKSIHHGQAFSEHFISTDAYPLELASFIRHKTEGRPFIVKKDMHLNTLSKAYKAKEALLDAATTYEEKKKLKKLISEEELGKVNKWLDKFRETFGYTKEELPEAYINNYGSIVAPRVGFRKYDKGGNLYTNGSELSSSRTVGIPAFYNRALGGIINTTNPILNYANNPHIGIPTVRY